MRVVSRRRRSAQGGKDAASSRYIFTKLEAVARKVFHPDDDAVLKYLDDDGQSIEPNYYVPVLPLALCNGADGIGTGWATSVPNYDPKQLIAVLRRMIAHAGDDVECDETSLLATCAAEDVGADGLAPSYRGFKGDVILKKAGSYQALGRVERLDDTKVLIDELPLRKWTHDYKQWCVRGVFSILYTPATLFLRRLEQQIVGDDKTTAWLKVRVRRPREFNSRLRHRRDASRTVRFPHRTSRRIIRIRPCRLL
jgi:DNA topoisomerase-2